MRPQMINQMSKLECIMSRMNCVFWTFQKKTQAQKNSNLKENPEKTQAKFRKNSKTGNSS